MDALKVGMKHTMEWVVDEKLTTQQSIRIIAPFPPGAGTDTLARTLSGPLSKALGQNIIVENRPGAGTVVGTEVAARAGGDLSGTLRGA